MNNINVKRFEWSLDTPLADIFMTDINGESRLLSSVKNMPLPAAVEAAVVVAYEAAVVAAYVEAAVGVPLVPSLAVSLPVAPVAPVAPGAPSEPVVRITQTNSSYPL